MTRKIYILFLLFIASVFVLNAQEEVVREIVTDEATDIVTDEVTDMIIVTDEMTVDADQNQAWRLGEYNYPAKPKNAFELGIHAGLFHINGDVPSRIGQGFGVGLHLRKAINYNFSWRLSGYYSRSKGLDARDTDVWTVANGDNPQIADQLIAAYGEDGRVFRNFNAKTVGANLSLIWNAGNILFHQPSTKWNAYLGVGGGFMTTSVDIDYFDGESGAYNWSGIPSDGGPTSDFDFGEVRSQVKEVLDGDYESNFQNERNVGFIFDNGKAHFQAVGFVGLARKLSRRVNLGFEYQVLAQDFDKWDGHEWRIYTGSEQDQTNDSDIGHYMNLRLGINLANFDKRSEPLYWMNPLDAAYNDIAALKRRPVLDLTDTDLDGVIDMMDMEIETKEGCAVDTRGIALDSDGDGCPDCEDPEPYSPPGYDMKDCVAQIPAPDMLDEADVIAIMNKNCPGCKNVVTTTKCGDWFLPMIHFDNNKSNIKTEFIPHLHHVATAMELCPDLCVTVYGHTDTRASDNYNSKLSYKRAQASIDYLTTKYGIPRSRFKLMYGGEAQPLTDNSTSAKKYINRRVEFRVCKDTDRDMSAPVEEIKPSAPVRVRGDKNSGY